MIKIVVGNHEMLVVVVKEVKARIRGVLPRLQDMPEQALIGPDSLWRLKCWNLPWSLPVLVLSYPWLDADHPDREGEQLRTTPF